MRSKGFTLIEAMVVLSILAIVMTFAVPAARNLMIRGALTGAANNVVAALTLARGQAINENRFQMAIMPAAGGWQNGWCVVRSRVANNPPTCDAAANDLIKLFEAPSRFVSVKAGPGANPIFNTTGVNINIPSGNTGSVVLCDSSGSFQGRTINFTRSGSVKTVKDTGCP